MLLGAASLNAAPASGVTAFVKDHHLTSYSVALIDMNGDNRPIADVPTVEVPALVRLAQIPNVAPCLVHHRTARPGEK